MAMVGMSLALLTLFMASEGPPAPPPDPGVTISRPAGAPESFARTLSEPGDWIEHRIVAGEDVDRIAARYGTSSLHVKLANQKLITSGGFRSGRSLRLKPRRTPPPRTPTTRTVKPGQDWVALARAYSVRYRDLRAWNWKLRKLRAGRTITLWPETDAPATLHPDRPLPRPTVTIHREGKSRGRPNLGRVENAVRLPKSWLYRLKSPPTAWGSSHAVKTILDAIIAFRCDFGFRGELIIGSLSRRYGRRFAPHASHQSGRDVDIFLPLVPEVPFSWKPNPWMVDWTATWALVKAFEKTGQVEMILLDYKVQKFLHEAARFSGASEEELQRLIGWPRLPADKDHRKALVRHGKDHTRHMHVRIHCGPNEERCYSRWGDARHQALQARERAEQRKGPKGRRRSTGQ